MGEIFYRRYVAANVGVGYLGCQISGKKDQGVLRYGGRVDVGIFTKLNVRFYTPVILFLCSWSDG